MVWRLHESLDSQKQFWHLKVIAQLTPEEDIMFDLEIRKPSKETVIGFIVTWICVIGIIFLTLALVRIGA